MMHGDLDAAILAEIHAGEAVSVTTLSARLKRPQARRTMRGHLKRLVAAGHLQARASRAGRVLFWRADGDR